ncbi:unnamed protein product [Vitrella brassicaformis CCMP3155]|uniref:Uncharacterized protein n=1 Tax=Vitrella brassicaformis (strain CCMP3155) TaxID=1169540 RepID=A0A0G4E9I5_VITBC|nr:unnamed protein product [Vitrella brassicaformis CCMP3155]|eukprot:CEL92048.1 unnamed protein product [Vitrella brassicaformis CCMP3155]
MLFDRQLSDKEVMLLYQGCVTGPTSAPKTTTPPPNTTTTTTTTTTTPAPTIAPPRPVSPEGLVLWWTFDDDNWPPSFDHTNPDTYPTDCVVEVGKE